MDNQYISPADNTGSKKGGFTDKKTEVNRNSKPELGGLTGFSLAEIIGKGASKLVFGQSKDREIVEQWIIDRKAESGNEPSEENVLENYSTSDPKKYFQRVKDLLRQVSKQLFRRQLITLSYL